MLRRSVLVLVAVAGASCLTATTASATTKCFCNNGTTVQSMTDGGDNDDCNDACDEFGGGRLWTPADEQSGSGGSDTTVRNPAAVEGAPAAERRAVERQR